MKIVFTGGGTGGHVIPNLAIIEKVRQLAGHAQIFYIGSKRGPERKLVEKIGVEFFGIQTGKLRRYFSWHNLTDVLKVPLGILQALYRLVRIRPNVVFSKGGFVSVPIVIAAGILRIPLVIHESDLTPGIATRIATHFARKICLGFPATHPGHKIQITGNPIRALGDTERGLKFLKFTNNRPIVFFAGGSSGATFLNLLLENSLFHLEKKVNIVWLTGRGKTAIKKINSPYLRIFDYLDEEYLDVLAASDLVVSRAGANALFEIAANGKPSILIPLPTDFSRGDQIENAHFFEKNGAAMVLPQEKAKPRDFAKLICWLAANKERSQKLGVAAKKLTTENSAERIAKIILDVAK